MQPEAQFEAWGDVTETLEVLGDDEQMIALHQAIQEVAQGQGKPWNTVKEELGWNEKEEETISKT